MSIVKQTKGMSYTNGKKGVKCEISVSIKGKVIRDSKSMTITDKMPEEVIVKALQKWKEETVATLKSGRPLNAENKPEVSWTVGRAIDELIKYWQKEGRKKTTIHTASINLNIIKRLLGEHMQLHEITDATIRDLRDRLLNGEECKHKNTEGSVNRKLSALSMMLKVAHEFGFSGMKSLPTIKRRSEKQSRRLPLTKEMQENMLSVCYELQEDDMDTFADLMLFTLLTGLRRSNVSLLKVNQLQMRGKIPVIKIDKDDFKGGRDHYVMLVDKALEIFKKHSYKKFGKDYVFTKTDGKHFTGSSILHRFNRLKHLAGYGNIKEVVWHSTRGAFITNCFDDKKLSPIEVRNIAGHVELSTTMGYYEQSEAAMQNTYDLLNKPDGGAQADNTASLKVIK
jgi:integrase